MLADRTNVIATIVLGPLVLYLAWRFSQWAVVNAVWTVPEEGGAAVCRAMNGKGACWAVITERFRFILLGAYPSGEQWRPALACLLFMGLYAGSTVRAWWKPPLALAWVVVPAAAVAVMRGGFAGLVEVPTESWGGLPLTFVFSTIGFTAAFPLAVLLALGRRSSLPAIRVLSTAYIETVRGVPLVTVLFMAAVMFPLFTPQAFVLDKLVRTVIAFTMVMAAYQAEVVRGGLAAIPSGQYQAAASLGLSFWHTTILIVLPQALRVSIPATVNTFIGFFKDTSLVAIIGLFDLLGAAKAVLADGAWIGFGVEVYLFTAVVYSGFCYAASRYGRHLERALDRGMA